MARRTLYDPLQAIAQPTWLVVRNKHRQALESKEIAAGVDLRVVLQAARSERITAGWACDDIGRAGGFFFAERVGERAQVGIERYDPAGPGHQSHCDPAPPMLPQGLKRQLRNASSVHQCGIMHTEGTDACGDGMDEMVWKLRSVIHGSAPLATGEQTFTTESGLRLAIETAWRRLETDLSATFPSGEVLDNAALRRHYPDL